MGSSGRPGRAGPIAKGRGARGEGRHIPLPKTPRCPPSPATPTGIPKGRSDGTAPAPGGFREVLPGPRRPQRWHRWGISIALRNLRGARGKRVWGRSLRVPPPPGAPVSPRLYLHVLPAFAGWERWVCARGAPEGPRAGPAAALCCALRRDETQPGEPEPCLEPRREIMQFQGWHNWENA